MNYRRVQQHTINTIIKIAAIKEKSWGNIMINKTDCKQWTTSLGENLVKDILKIKGENPRKPLTKNNLKYAMDKIENA